MAFFLTNLILESKHEMNIKYVNFIYQAFQVTPLDMLYSYMVSLSLILLRQRKHAEASENFSA